MMGRKRKLPFGYKMEQGRVVVHTGENTWVSYLFQQYNFGVSMRELTEQMKKSGVQYDVDKTWNINMIARILADERYLGRNGFPTIIDPCTFTAASEKRGKKAPAIQMTEAYKILRQKCGRKITPHIEQEVLYLLNTLAGHPERIHKPETPMTQSRRLDMLQSELEDIMLQLPVDEELARKKLIEIAEAMYENIDPREYETQRMRLVFQKEEKREELDADLIAANISDILVDSTGKVRIRLKNDQIIERGE